MIKIDGVRCSTVVFIEADEMPDYNTLKELGVISFTDYNTKEIRVDTVRTGRENFEGVGYDELLENNIDVDVLNILMNDKLDVILVV
jgi:hypothetical protein